jgi:hypothetical protein
MIPTNFPYSTGDALDADDLNELVKGTRETKIQAGESLGVYKVVYLDDATGKWLTSSSADETTARVDGFTLETAAANSLVTVQTDGICGGFAGLDAGKTYYLSTNGAISATAGTVKAKVGIALDANTLLIQKDLPEILQKFGIATRDMTTASGNQTIAHGLGRTPKYIKITANFPASDYIGSFGSYDGTSTACIYDSGDAGVGGTSTTYVVYIAVTNSGQHQIATATIDDTNITLAWTKSGTPSGTAYLFWEVIG